MAITGIIERSSAVTLPRVLERIFDHEQPGLLRLRHLASGKTARVKIDAGAVQETIYGELQGDTALKEISATFPWEYEFVARDAANSAGLPPVPPEVRPAKKPALKLAGSVKPMMLNSGEISAGFAAREPAAPEAGLAVKAERKSAFMAKRPAAPQGPSSPSPAAGAEAEQAAPAESRIPAAPGRRMKQWPDARSLAEWVEGSDEYAIRFAKSGDTALGKIAGGEWEYFRADSASLMLWAAGIGETLGYSAPLLAALVEPQRAAAYRRLEEGFAGIYSGPETTVDTIIGIP